jgi:hypothetical protein
VALVVDGGAEQGGEDLGPRAGRVLRDVRHRQPRLHRHVDGLGAPLGDERHVPLLDELPDGARTDEGADLDGHPRSLADVDDGLDVGHGRAPRAAHPDGHFAGDDLLAQSEHVLEGALAAARQAHVGVLDAQILHQVENPQLVIDGGVLHAGVLQPVTEGLVEEGKPLRDEGSSSIELVPIENKVPGPLPIRSYSGHDSSIGHRAWTSSKRPSFR